MAISDAEADQRIAQLCVKIPKLMKQIVEAYDELIQLTRTRPVSSSGLARLAGGREALAAIADVVRAMGEN